MGGTSKNVLIESPARGLAALSRLVSPDIIPDASIIDKDAKYITRSLTLWPFVALQRSVRIGAIRIRALSAELLTFRLAVERYDDGRS